MEYQIIGFTDSINECDCCGKTGLKGTYCVSILGDEKYYGSTCVKRNLNIPTDAVLNSEIKKYITLQKLEANKKFIQLGGKEMESKLPLIDFCTEEWDELHEKVMSLKQSICLEFKIKNF